MVPLDPFNENAGKATCKGYYRSPNQDPAGYYPPTYQAPNPNQIYDPVVRQRGDVVIGPNEHQVTQQQQGSLLPTDGAKGPQQPIP